jgi:predicted ATP-grasp superfamily ATP-dependent carboligase
MGNGYPGPLRVFIHEYVTGGGLASEDLPAGWEAEGRLMRRALAGDFAALPEVSVVMTLDQRLPDEPGPWTTVRIGPGDEETEFLRLAAEADFTLVIAPETGGCLETRAHWIRDADGESLGSDPEAISLAADKLLLARTFVRRDVRTPPTRRYSQLEGLPVDFRYPAVLKPIDGAGTMDTWVIPSSDDRHIEQFFPHPSGLLQTYTNGRPMSASFLVSDVGRPRLVAVGEQRIELVANRLQYRGGEISGDVECCDSHVRRAVELVPGLRGFVGVDFLWNETTGRSTVLEINPRPTTSAHALVRMLGPGVLAAEWLRILDDGPDPGGLPAMLAPEVPFSFSVTDEAIDG